MNHSVFYGVYSLRYWHPFFYHCYYTYVEAVEAISTYMNLNSGLQILYNLIYQTRVITDESRRIARVVDEDLYENRDLYVLGRSIGRLI